MGNLCDGVSAHNQKQITNSRAFCEGVAARTASNSPTNPHVVGSEASTSWLAGVAVAAAAAGSTVPAANAPCCAVSGATVPV